MTTQPANIYFICLLNIIEKMDCKYLMAYYHTGFH